MEAQPHTKIYVSPHSQEGSRRGSQKSSRRNTPSNDDLAFLTEVAVEDKDPIDQLTLSSLQFPGFDEEGRLQASPIPIESSNLNFVSRDCYYVPFVAGHLPITAGYQAPIPCFCKYFRILGFSIDPPLPFCFQATTFPSDLAISKVLKNVMKAQPRFMRARITGACLPPISARFQMVGQFALRHV